MSRVKAELDQRGFALAILEEFSQDWQQALAADNPELIGLFESVSRITKAPGDSPSLTSRSKPKFYWGDHLYPLFPALYFLIRGGERSPRRCALPPNLFFPQEESCGKIRGWSQISGSKIGIEIKTQSNTGLECCKNLAAERVSDRPSLKK